MMMAEKSTKMELMIMKRADEQKSIKLIFEKGANREILFCCCVVNDVVGEFVYATICNECIIDIVDIKCCTNISIEFAPRQ
jgi:hypothetical protein